jgi:predicted acylesterase/phospholipase RssA
MPKQQIALVLRGGVSLGAYIAGALDELMHALAATNDYVIDIITGASAGATTAAIVARGLLYHQGTMDLHDVWVRSIDIIDLLDPQMPADAAFALLNDRPLHQVAQRIVDGIAGTTEGRRAAWVAPRLTVAMTLGNTTTLSYISRVRMPAAGRTEEYVQYRHAEQEAFVLNAYESPDPQQWRRIVNVALASAAFPFAFPPVALRRSAGDENHYIQRPAFKGEAEFWYYDGGAFNNLPLDLAWHYAHIHAARSGNNVSQDRMMVVIAPTRNDITPVPPAITQPNLRAYTAGLLGGLLHESGALQLAQDGWQQSDQPLQAIPGVERMSIELLGNIALIMPKVDDQRLCGSYLRAFSAFLDQRFREYDFRRGAADARRVAQEVLDISYDSKRPESFYRPDEDPALRCDLSSYAALGEIASTRHPRMSVQQVFEIALKRRIRAITGRWKPWILRPAYAKIIEHCFLHHIPKAWSA